MKILVQNLLVLFLICLSSFTSLGQSPPFTSCPNSNFSQGTFENWAGCYGTAASPCSTQGFDSTSAWPRHKIITDVTALDPNTCNNMLKIIPGETHSARVGREGGTGTSGAQLKYEFQVTSQPYYFVFRYAIVLDDGYHEPYMQASFGIEIMDSSGNYVDPVLGNQYFMAGPGQPGWQTCGSPLGTNWKNWSTDTVDLSSFVGQTVTATFTSRDCFYGGHHGYAYISAYCVNPVTRQWTGALSAEWDDPGNWLPEGVPSAIDIVIIPQSAITMPVLNVTGMTCGDLMLDDGATITIPEGFTLTVDGDLYLHLPK